MPRKPKGDRDRINDLLGGITVPTGESTSGDNQTDGDRYRVEFMLLSLIRPDPVQPRRVLPSDIHQKFHQNKVTPSQALSELIQTVKSEAREQGRTIDKLEDLTPRDEDDDDVEDLEYSPEENALRDLINLAITIRDDGQVNPLTVVDVSDGAQRGYRIETGERRYWATWLLREFIMADSHDGTIPCIVIPMELYSPFRQAKENTARKGLTAIAMARQAALLLLVAHDYEIPTQEVTNDFYRQALELDLRGKRDLTEQIYSAMGGIGRRRFSQFKSLLKLSDDAWEIADRYNVDEKVLRQVINLPEEKQIDVVNEIAKHRLSASQVEKLLNKEPESKDKHKSISDESVKVARRFARFAVSIDKKQPTQEASNALIEKLGSVEAAREQIQQVKKFLEDVENALPS